MADPQYVKQLQNKVLEFIHNSGVDDDEEVSAILLDLSEWCEAQASRLDHAVGLDDDEDDDEDALYNKDMRTLDDEDDDFE